MRAFLKKFGLFAVIQIIIGLAVYRSYHLQHPTAQNFLAASLDKHSLIRTQAAPRLILMSGSSMAFGVNSPEIAAACGRQSVNMALNAGLGLRFMFREVEPWIQRGDWIIVAPEYEHFSGAGESEIQVNMIEIDPANARLLSSHEWAEALDRGAIQRLGKIARAAGVRTLLFPKEPMKNVPPFYRRSGFNQNGDMVAHLTMKPPPMTADRFQFRYREALVDDTIDRINQFAKLAEARGAKVFFSHPPLPRELFDQNRDQLNRLELELKTRLTVSQLDRADEMVFPLTDFFDTFYHLAASGVEKRSKLLASRLKEQTLAAAN